MGLLGRTSLARILLLSLVLSALPLAAAAAEPAPVQVAPAATSARRNRCGRPPGVTGRARAGAGPVRGAGGGPDRRAAAAAVDGTVMAGSGRTRVVRLDRRADVRAAARRLAGRPGVASAEPDWLRRVDDCDPGVCWRLQPNQGLEHGANVVASAGNTGDRIPSTRPPSRV
jgi:hypothetical protein